MIRFAHYLYVFTKRNAKGKVMKKKKVTLQSIADHFGVTKVTVYRAIHGQPGVGDELRNSILIYAHKLKFDVPINESENNLKTRTKPQTNKVRSIAIIREDKELEPLTHYYEMIHVRLTEAISKANYFSHTYVTKRTDTIDDIPDITQGINLVGIMVIGRIDEELLLQISKKYSDKPLVCVGWTPKRYRFSSITIDAMNGSYELTKYLIRIGHTKIIYATTEPEMQRETNRYLGHQKALIEAGFEYKPEYLLKIDVDKQGHFYESGLERILEFKPSAIACSSDYHASVIINFMKEKGLVAGKDYSIVGFGNFHLPSVQGTKLTTYDLEMPAMVQLAVDTIRIFEGRKIDYACILKPRGVIVKGNTVVDLNKKDSE